jgi:hypothetical protein
MVRVRAAPFYFVLGVRKGGRRGHKSTARTRWKCYLFVSCKHREGGKKYSRKSVGVLKRRGAKGKVFGFQREATASAIANRNTFLDLHPATFQAHHATLSLTCSESILFLPFDGKLQCFEPLVNRTSTGNTFDRHVIGAVFVHVLHLGETTNKTYPTGHSYLALLLSFFSNKHSPVSDTILWTWQGTLGFCTRPAIFLPGLSWAELLLLKESEFETLSPHPQASAYR